MNNKDLAAKLKQKVVNENKRKDRELAKKLMETVNPGKLNDKQLAQKLMESTVPGPKPLSEGMAVAAAAKPETRVGVVESVKDGKIRIRTDKGGLVMEFDADKLVKHAAAFDTGAFTTAPPELGFSENADVALSDKPEVSVATVKEVKLSGEGVTGEYSVVLEVFDKESELDGTYVFEFSDGKFVDGIPFVAGPERKTVVEGEEEKEIKDATEVSEILLAANSINKSLGEMKKKCDDMETEQMDKMIEAIKVHYEDGVAENFRDIVGNTLTNLIDSLREAQEEIGRQIAFFANPDDTQLPGSMDTEMNMDMPDGEGEGGEEGETSPESELPPEDDPVPGDELAGDVDSPLGRVEKP